MPWQKFEEPPWMVAKIDQLLADVQAKIGHSIAELGVDSLMLFLSEPGPHATQAEREAWEHTCDKCGARPPKGVHSGTVARTIGKVKVLVGFGLCTFCKDQIR